jgi:sugar phosphate isomerase/epimerase
MVIDQGEYRPTADFAAGVIRNALANLASAGTLLALENHDRLPASDFKMIIDEVDSGLAGICLDCVNSMGIGEGLETVLTNLAPYTVNLHVKDFIVKRVSHMMGFVVEGVPAGKGFLNLPHLLAVLAPYGRCQSAILEQWTPPEENLNDTMNKEEAWAKESILYLKKTIPQP